MRRVTSAVRAGCCRCMQGACAVPVCRSIEEKFRKAKWWRKQREEALVRSMEAKRRYRMIIADFAEIKDGTLWKLRRFVVTTQHTSLEVVVSFVYVCY